MQLAVADSEDSDVEQNRGQPRRKWRAAGIIMVTLAVVGTALVALHKATESPQTLKGSVSTGPFEIKAEEDLNEATWFCKRNAKMKSHYPTCKELNYGALCCIPSKATASNSQHKSVEGTRCMENGNGPTSPDKCTNLNKKEPPSKTIEDLAKESAPAKEGFLCEDHINYPGSDLGPRVGLFKRPQPYKVGTDKEAGLEACAKKCKTVSTCETFVWNQKGECWPKTIKAKRMAWWPGKLIQEHLGEVTTGCVKASASPDN